MSMKKSAAGFTLLEMAIVMLIIGLLLGGLLMPLANRVELERRQETADRLEAAEEALLGFAVINGRLPCPDTDGDGLEDAASCATEGDLPWATLGAGRWDAWSRRIRYRADAAFNAVAIPDPPAGTTGLNITDLAGNALSDVGLLPDGPVAAILFSCGADGLPNSGNDANGVDDNPTCENPIAAPPPDTAYVQDVPSEVPVFDDMLIWLSKNSLLNRMVAAGRWP